MVAAWHALGVSMSGAVMVQKEQTEEVKPLAPIVCGGIYERLNLVAQRIDQGTCLAVRIRETRQGRILFGEFRFYGETPIRIKADSDELRQLTLIGRPASPKVGRPRKVPEKKRQ